MSFDGFFISRLIEELKNLIGSRVEKVSFDGADSFLFSLYNRGIKLNLIIDTNTQSYSFYSTKKGIENNPNQFSNILKKNLEGSILNNISQYRTDRVIVFEFSANDLLLGHIEKKLIFEAMGKHANLFLVFDNRIIDLHKKMWNENGRTLLPKAEFEFFKSDKKEFHNIDYSKIYSAREITSEYLGISPVLAEYLYNKKVQLGSIKTSPTRNNDNNRYYVFNIFNTYNTTSFKSLSELLDSREVYASETYKKEFNFIKKNLDKHLKKKEILLQSLYEAESELKFKETGDMIYSSGLDLKENYSDIGGIALDPKISLNMNAQSYYKKYQKAKRGIIHINEQIKINDDLIELFENMLSDLDYQDKMSIDNFRNILSAYGYKTDKKMNRPNKNNKRKISITKYDENDFTVYIGKNNVENEYLIHELAGKDDYWFHVKDAPGSHVILKTDHINEHQIRLSSMLAAFYSKNKYSSSIAVDYTKVRNLKKIPKKPLYSVTYSDYKTMFIDIDEGYLKQFI